MFCPRKELTSILLVWICRHKAAFTPQDTFLFEPKALGGALGGTAGGTPYFGRLGDEYVGYYQETKCLELASLDAAVPKHELHSQESQTCTAVATELAENRMKGEQ